MGTARYAVELTNDPLESHVLVDREADARVTIAPARGGMVTRFDVRGAPVLYLDEATLRDPTKNVRGGIPVLFPIAGPLRDDRYLVDGAPRIMKQHGYARNRAWPATFTKEGDHLAMLGMDLLPDAASRAQYPFDVVVRMIHSLEGGALTIQRDVANRGAVPAPIQPGLHPYFFVDDARKHDARVETNATRGWDNVAKREVDVTPPIALDVPELDLHLLDHSTPGEALPVRATLHRPGRPSVRLEYSGDHDVLVLWTLAGRDFVCVEPWVGRAGALSDGNALLVPPSSRHVSRVTIALVDP